LRRGLNAGAMKMQYMRSRRMAAAIGSRTEQTDMAVGGREVKPLYSNVQLIVIVNPLRRLS